MHTPPESRTEPSARPSQRAGDPGGNVSVEAEGRPLRPTVLDQGFRDARRIR